MITLQSLSKLLQAILSSVKVNEGSLREVKFLKERCKFGCVVELPGGFSGDNNELGLLSFHFSKLLPELVELVGVVQAHGSAQNAFDDSSDESFVLDSNLEVNGGLVQGGTGRALLG
jgi:hypothetical protein